MVELEVIGAMAFLVFGVICAFLALHLRRFTRYGQEALLASGAMCVTAGTMRFLVLAGWLERDQGLTVNTIAAVSFLILGGQLAVLRYIDQHIRRR